MPCDLSVILLFTVLTIYCSWGGWIFYHLHLEALHFVTLWLQSKNNWFFMALHFWDRSLASILLSDLLHSASRFAFRSCKVVCTWWHVNKFHMADRRWSHSWQEVENKMQPQFAHASFAKFWLRDCMSITSSIVPLWFYKSFSICPFHCKFDLLNHEITYALPSLARSRIHHPGHECCNRWRGHDPRRRGAILHFAGFRRFVASIFLCIHISNIGIKINILQCPNEHSERCGYIKIGLVCKARPFDYKGWFQSRGMEGAIHWC